VSGPADDMMYTCELGNLSQLVLEFPSAINSIFENMRLEIC